MPVNPPYGIIDTIARLREQGGQAWGQAAQSVGQSVGNAAAGIGQAVAQKYHDATMAWDKNFEEHQHIQPTGPGQAAPDTTGMSNLAHFYQSRGLKPPKGSENVWGKPKTQEKSEAAQIIQAMKDASSGAKGHTALTKEQADTLSKKTGLSWSEGQMAPDSVLAQASKSGSSQALSPDQQSALEWGVQNKLLAPQQMTFRGPKTMVMAEMLGKMKSGSIPQQSLIESDTNMSGQKATATTTAAKSADIRVNLGSAHGGFSASMDRAKELAKEMGQGKVAQFNKAWQAGKREFNDPQSIEFAAQINNAINNYARIAKGGSASIGEDDIKHADTFLSTKLNEGGLAAVEKAVETEYKGRIGGLSSGKEGAASKYSDPTKAKKIADAYKKGPQTPEAYAKAKKELDALSQ